MDSYSLFEVVSSNGALRSWSFVTSKRWKLPSRRGTRKIRFHILILNKLKIQIQLMLEFLLYYIYM